MLSRWISVLFVVLATVSRDARADEVAPALEGADLRVHARAELKALVATLDIAERTRLVGIYVAFDDSVVDPIAQVACDDDGDYVVLLSDAMLRLVAQIARADTADERRGSSILDEYASFVARTQVPGRRIVPPAPGFFVEGSHEEPSEERLHAALSFVIADELERLRARDLVCARPTATRERGDDVWTAAEARAAAQVAVAVYPAHDVERDAAAFARVRKSGRSERGALAVTRFFAKLEAARTADTRFAPSYSRAHPNPGARLRNLEDLPKVE